MKKFNKILIAALLSLNTFLFIPYFSNAALNCGSGFTQDPSGVCVKSNKGPGLLGVDSASELIVKIISLLLAFGGMIAVLFIVIGGYRYVTSQGNEKAAESGKKTVLSAVIGLVIIIFAYAIVRLVNVFVTR